MLGRQKLTEQQKAAKQARKALERAERDRINAERRALEEQARQERFENFPEFIVREVREVRVKAGNGGDAIALATAAFKEGQDHNHSIKWGRPWGVEGDTIGPIEVVNVKAGKDD